MNTRQTARRSRQPGSDSTNTVTVGGVVPSVILLLARNTGGRGFALKYVDFGGPLG